MAIKSYGLFWRADEIDWHPGKGVRSFHLFGRNGTNTNRIEMADFRMQQGIYILYDDYGPYYVGLTRMQGLGKRLKDHRSDEHRGKWDRFSWFGFCALLVANKTTGLRPLRKMPESQIAAPKKWIGDVEALLILAMGTSANFRQMNFHGAQKWTQVEEDRVEYYKGRL